MGAYVSVQDRAAILLKIADRMEQNLELLATAETDNGKPIRETSAADVPLAIDHFAISPPVYVRRRADQRS